MLVRSAHVLWRGQEAEAKLANAASTVHDTRTRFTMREALKANHRAKL